MDDRDRVLRQVIKELSTPSFFYDSTIDDAINYVCHKQEISLAVADREYIHEEVVKFFEELINGQTET